MKRIFVLVGVMLFMVQSSVWAAAIGGVPTVKKGKFSLGTDLSFGFGQDFDFKSADGLDADEKYKDVEKDNEYQWTVKASYGICDLVNIYAKLGIADYETTQDYYKSGVKKSRLESDSDTGASYGIGLSGTYDLNDGWLIGWDLQYFYMDQETTATNTPVSGAVQVVEYNSLIYSGWHIAPFVAKKIDRFTPYAGIRYSDADLEIKKPNTTGVADNLKYEADDNVGLFLGTDYALDDNWRLNFEARFLDEDAISIGVNYSF